MYVLSFYRNKGTGNMLKEKLLYPKAAIRICQFKKNFINLNQISQYLITE